MSEWKNSVVEWKDAATTIPKVEDYNKDGSVIVAYEDGTVSKGWYSSLNEKWAHLDRHGKALFWAPYPEHPMKEETRKRV